VVYDFRIIGYDADGHAIVGVFFAPADRILAYVRVLEQAEVFPREVTLSTQGLVDRVALDAPEEVSVYILYAGSRGYEFCAAQAGVPVFSRTFSAPGPPADRPVFLLREVKISFEMFRRLKGLPGEVFGGVHVVGRLEKREAAALAPYLKSLHESDVSFSRVLGLGLHPAGRRIDMMPLRVKERVRQRVRWRAGFRCFVAGYCLLWSVFLFSWSATVRHARAAASYRDMWQQALPDVERFTVRAVRAAFARGAWGPAGMAILLEEIFADMPAGTVLTRVRAERGVILLSGSAPDAAAVLGLRRALAGSPLFSQVVLEFLGREAQRETQTFRLRCTVKR